MATLLEQHPSSCIAYTVTYRISTSMNEIPIHKSLIAPSTSLTSAVTWIACFILAEFISQWLEKEQRLQAAQNAIFFQGITHPLPIWVSLTYKQPSFGPLQSFDHWYDAAVHGLVTAACTRPTTPQLQGPGGRNRILGSHPHNAPNFGLDSFGCGQGAYD